MKYRFEIPSMKIVFVFTLMLLFVIGCSSGADDDEGDGTIVDPEDVNITEIYVEADPSSINVSETSAVTATVYDSSGSPISGVQVQFYLDLPSLASISPSLVTTDANGVARATLTARDNQGNVVITATSGDVTSNEASLGILSGVSPDTINVTATPSTILIRGTSNIEATVVDETGAFIADGTAVSFTVSNSNFGTMSADLATTSGGTASATFTALEQPGTATVEVSVGAINNSVDILINATEPAALQFVSADPQRIALQGSGGNESSDVTFKVVDGNGEAVQGVSVAVNIEKGPNGGEYIDDDATPKEIVISSDADGLALVTLRSGTIPGAVTLKGAITVDGVTFSTNASVVSIGGGVPTSSRFSISADPRNIPGLDLNGVTTDITAWMSDRYGNYNILSGTTVSFWSETALSVDASEATVDEDGTATVSARTQHPVLASSTGGLNVEPLQWELNLASYLLTTYNFTSPSLPNATHPRDGQVSILAITQGEEYFRDDNANGIYDTGEDYDDTHDDPFIDVNDNDTHDDGSGVDPFEEYSDSNVNPGWDSYNGVWDSQKDIFSSNRLLITGEPIITYVPTIPGFSIANAGSQSFKFIVCDRNLNYISAGSTISVSAEGGGKVRINSGLTEPPDYSFVAGEKDNLADATALALHLGRIEYTATISDDAADETKLRNVTIVITVSWEGGTYETAFSGQIY
jgi:hypothetical protein